MANETKLILDPYNVKIIKDKLNGIIEVDEDTRKSRFSICQSCDELTEKWHTCKICSCWMPVKARIPGTKCPIGKW
jgi:hypothetical protein